MQKIATVRGLKIRYVDLNPVTGAINSEKLAALIDEKTKVILVAQLLGMKHDLQAVRQLIGDRDILLVEDCAQCFDGEYTGANAADVSMFSFGPIKFQTALCGAVFIVRNRHLLHRMQQQVGQLPLAANTWFVKRLVKYSLLKLISSRPLFGLLDLCFQLVRKNTDEIIYRWSRGFGQRNLDQKMNMQLPPAADRFLSHKLSLEKGRIHRRIPKSEWVRYQHAAVSDETLRQMRRRGEAVSNRAGSLCCLGDQPDLPGAEAFLQNLLLSNSRKR